MKFACMGGMCRIRETCEHYHATHRPTVVERLCDAGHDGEMTERPVVIVRNPGAWETAHLAKLVKPAHPFGGIAA